MWLATAIAAGTSSTPYHAEGPLGSGVAVVTATDICATASIEVETGEPTPILAIPQPADASVLIDSYPSHKKRPSPFVYSMRVVASFR